MKKTPADPRAEECDRLERLIKSEANAAGLVMYPTSDAALSWFRETIAKLREQVRNERRDRLSSVAALSAEINELARLDDR